MVSARRSGRGDLVQPGSPLGFLGGSLWHPEALAPPCASSESSLCPALSPLGAPEGCASSLGLSALFGHLSPLPSSVAPGEGRDTTA